MTDFFKVSIFSLLMVGAFWGYSSFGIPQIKPADPPGEAKVDLGDMSMDKFIALGAELFDNKGDCTLCHNERGRAPMLDKIGPNAEKTMKNPAYKGTAKTVEEYIYESMMKPSAYVVPTFGKKGTNDTVSPMPEADGPKTDLSPVEIAAVIAYLQDSSGAEVTVKIPKMGDSAKGAEKAKAEDCKK
jgi:mono/diheme cytochrome c family protein